MFAMILLILPDEVDEYNVVDEEREDAKKGVCVLQTLKTFAAFFKVNDD